MALINDPDDLNQATEVIFDTGALTIELIEAGALSSDGVIEKAVYSFTNEEWKDDSQLVGFPFPFTPLSDEFFEIGIDPSGNASGWTWKNALSRNLIRRGGWKQRNATGAETEHWSGFAILNAEADDQIYYDIGDGPVDFVYAGNTQEAVLVRSDPNGDGSYADGFDRSNLITVYNRQQGQLYSSNSSLAIGESSLLFPKLYSLGLPTGVDLNITANDATISSTAPWNGMKITYFASPQSRTVGANVLDFGVIIDGNGGTLEQIYEFVQYQLRQNSDIDAGSGLVLGKTADELLAFVGGVGDGTGSLETLNVNNPAGGGSGVFIDDRDPQDVNRVSFRDNTSPATAVGFPRKATLILEPNDNCINEASAKYFVFFEDPDGAANGNEFATAGATLVPIDGGGSMTGLIGGQSTIALSYDFDGDTTGGRIVGSAVPVIIVAVGAGGVQYFRTRQVLNFPSTTVALSNAVERNYENA